MINLFYLLNWLDAKLEITESKNDCINRRDLYRYVKVNYFNYSNNTTSDFVKTLLNIYFTFSTKEQRNYTHFEYVKHRDIKNINKKSLEYIIK